jgi:DNA-binding GntR family transcriptional regulator
MIRRTPVAGAGLSLVRARSLAEQVADSIVDGIASGALEPGQRIVELELAGELKVSRVPVREAIRTLVAQGIVESNPHRGTRIVEFDEAKIDRICQVRAALEKLAVHDAAKNYLAHADELKRLDAIIEQMDGAVRQNNRFGVNKCDIAFHREICAASRNEIVMILWEALARHISIIFGREILSERDLDLVVDQHRDLRAALAAGGDALDDEIDRHIMRLRRPDRRRNRRPARASHPRSRRESLDRT